MDLSREGSPVTESEALVKETIKQEDALTEDSKVQDKQGEEGDGEEDEDEDDEEDDDYDPEAKPAKEANEEEEESEDDEPEPDYSAIQSSGISEVKTRHQKQLEKSGFGSTNKRAQYQQMNGYLQDESHVDVDSLFEDLKRRSNDPSLREREEYSNHDTPEVTQEQENRAESTEQTDLGPQKIKIQTSYTFAGKLITESKLVDADSAEAKAYLNSTNGLTAAETEDPTKTRSYVTVIREVPGTKEQVPLRIKLKRPSLIDKFLSSYNNKRQKLSTLEKSRLDWASFVDQRKLQDDLKLHNKAGYLDKQEFLGRLDAKRDEQYVKAREEDRKRQWQLQQQSL